MENKEIAQDIDNLRKYISELETKLENSERNLTSLKLKHESIFEELNQQNQILQSFNEEMKLKNDEYAYLNKKYASQNEELKASNEKLLFLTNQIEEFLYLTNAEGEILYAAGNTEQLFGVSLKVLKSMTIRQLCDFFELSAEMQSSIFEITLKAIQHKQHKAFYTFNLTVNDCERWFKTTEQLQYDENGNFNGSIGLMRDITAQKQYEISLLENEEKFRAIFEMSEDMICIADMKSTRFLEINPSFSRVLGYSEQEILATSFLDFIHPDDLEYTLEIVRSNFGRGILTFSFTNRYGCKNGTYRWLDWSTYSIPEKGITYGIAHDITDRIKTQQQLEEQNKRYEKLNKELKRSNSELMLSKEKAEESNRLKSAFLNNISHEFRTPVNGILGFSELLMKPEATSEEREFYAKYIKESSQQLIDTVMDTIEIAHVQSDTVSLNYDNFDVVKLIKDTTAIVEEKVTYKKLQLELQLDFNLPEVNINSDQYKIKKIVKHLIENAIKFTAKGKITVCSSQTDEDHIMISVSDTGIGISEEMQPVIFKPFMQVESGLSVSHGGNGIGLSLVKAYVDILKGDIMLESTVNKGTTITVKIPVDFLAEGNNGSFDQWQDVEWSDKTILIAEDEEVNRKYLVELLKGKNCNLICASDGKEAVDFCRKNAQIDLILMDLKMPYINGYEATQLIKEFRKDIPVIAQTAFALEKDKKMILSSGFNGYVIKPIDEKDLLTTISKYLGKRV